MVVSRCRGIGPPSGIPSAGLFLLAAELRRHPTADLGLAESKIDYENPSRRLAISQRAACIQACTADRRAVTHPPLRQTAQARVNPNEGGSVLRHYLFFGVCGLCSPRCHSPQLQQRPLRRWPKPRRLRRPYGICVWFSFHVSPLSPSYFGLTRRLINGSVRVNP